MRAGAFLLFARISRRRMALFVGKNLWAGGFLRPGWGGLGDVLVEM